MEESEFDVVIFGTGLVESIIAAALSKAGYKVAHIDSNPYYGGDEASLSLEDLVKWADNAAQSPDSAQRFQRISRSPDIPSQSRQYSICLQPSVIPAVGPLISSLVMSGVAKYSGFRLLDSVSVYDSSGRARGVPGSKEDIFKSKDISLIEKRRLMRFLTFAAGDFSGKKEIEGKEDTPFIEFLQSVFSLSPETSSVIAFSLAFCMSSMEPTLPCLERLQRYLRSGGRYGPSPFLIGHYGGIGDIAQGFCRAAAVSGGVYILSRKVTKVIRTPPPEPTVSGDEEPTSVTRSFNYAIDLEDFPDTLSCNLIISPPSYVPVNMTGVRQLPFSSDKFVSQVQCIARCIAIIDQALAVRSLESPQQSESTSSPEPSNEDGPESTPAAAATPPPVDTAIVIFPPSSVTEGSSTHSATVLINGEGSLSTPKGKWIVYISLPLPSVPEASVVPESLLRPYLDALLALSADPSHSPIKPLFSTFFLETPASNATPSTAEVSIVQESHYSYLVPAPLRAASLPDIPDQATYIAEFTYREAVKFLRATNMHEDNAEAEAEDIVFWPPIPADEEDDDNEW